MTEIISTFKRDYTTSQVWLLGIDTDSAWVNQLSNLVTEFEKNVRRARQYFEQQLKKLMAYIPGADLYWSIYNHNIEATVNELWAYVDESLFNLKLCVLGMKTANWIDEHYPLSAEEYEGQPRGRKKAQLLTVGTHRHYKTFTKHRMLDAHVTLLYKQMTDARWIDCTEADFRDLFSGDVTDTRITWTGLSGKASLTGLFKALRKAELISADDGSIPTILSNHFIDTQGNYLTHLDKGASLSVDAAEQLSEWFKVFQIRK